MNSSRRLRSGMQFSYEHRDDERRNHATARPCTRRRKTTAGLYLRTAGLYVNARRDLPVVSQAERRAGTVAAILAAAQQLFAKRGFAATTIDDIAGRAGVAKGAVYHHFGSKEEILERVLDGIFVEIAARLRMAAGPSRDLFETMVKGTEIYLERVTAPEVKRISLVDGPAVLGW